MIDTNDIFSIKTDSDFRTIALEVFQFQFRNNPVYRSFCDLLYVHPSDVKHIEDIPFLPIQFFKSHTILSHKNTVQKTFTSSGTTGQITSKHHVTDIKLYEKSFRKGFQQFYGDIKGYAVLGLLPSYLERDGSSLIYMVNDLIKRSEHPKSGFYLNNFEDLKQTLLSLEASNTKILLVGVSFALLDFTEQYPTSLNRTIIMETGGMKGRRKELIREELHHQLKTVFNVNEIHSEYGMTELLSQAYSLGKGNFKAPSWMRVLIRDTEDALTIQANNKTGGINIIDLANVNSCAFIATQDLGRIYSDNSFEVIGRFDNSDIRGCNLMTL